MSDEIVDEYMKEKGIMQTHAHKDYTETRIFQHGKYSIWQCRRKGMEKHYELREDVKLWEEIFLCRDRVLRSSINFIDVEERLKELLPCPQPVDEDVIDRCNKLKEMLK